MGTSVEGGDGQPGDLGVPAQVFRSFIEAVGGDVPAEVAPRLRKTLIEDRIFTERALRAAIFGEDSGL